MGLVLKNGNKLVSRRLGWWFTKIWAGSTRLFYGPMILVGFAFLSPKKLFATLALIGAKCNLTELKILTMKLII
ncbi:hypothetical protein Hanom_Chr16g01508241 [Helianthus anomalus]